MTFRWLLCNIHTIQLQAEPLFNARLHAWISIPLQARLYSTQHKYALGLFYLQQSWFGLTNVNTNDCHLKHINNIVNCLYYHCIIVVINISIIHIIHKTTLKQTFSIVLPFSLLISGIIFTFTTVLNWNKHALFTNNTFKD